MKETLRLYSLWRQCLDVPDLPGGCHGEPINDVEVLLPKEEQPLTGVKALNPSTAVHVLDLGGKADA